MRESLSSLWASKCNSWTFGGVSLWQVCSKRVLHFLHPKEAILHSTWTPWINEERVLALLAFASYATSLKQAGWIEGSHRLSLGMLSLSYSMVVSWTLQLTAVLSSKGLQLGCTSGGVIRRPI